MAAQRRRELVASLRLAVRDEQWFLLDLLLAVVGFIGWVAATGAITALGAREAGIQIVIEQGSTRTLALLAGAVVCWVVLPALAATLRVRSRVTNVSGNVAKRYRFESPGTLLWPPVVGLLVGFVAVLASPVAWPAFTLTFLAGASLLVRTEAYSYRVFSLSYPLVVHVIAFVTFSLYALTGVVQLGAVAGVRGMVVDAVAVLGVPVDVYGTVGPSALALPTVLTVAAGTPVVLVAGYLLVQSLVGAYVRWAEPSVDRGSLRAGQRNPFQPTAANGAGSHARRPNAPSAASQSDDEPSVPVHVQTTRVYDPDDEVADAAGIETGTADRGGPNCRTCGAAFSPGTEIRFCPNCGERLDDG